MWEKCVRKSVIANLWQGWNTFKNSNKFNVHIICVQIKLNLIIVCKFRSLCNRKVGFKSSAQNCLLSCVFISIKCWQTQITTVFQSASKPCSSYTWSRVQNSLSMGVSACYVHTPNTTEHCSQVDGTSALYTEGPCFRFQLGSCYPDGGFLWFSSVPQGKCWDSISDYDHFPHILPNSLVPDHLMPLR
jgi:hypothetical protein